MKIPAETIQVTLEKPVYGGYSLGRHEGKAVLVPYGIPGETVSVAITLDKKDYCMASISDIIEKDAGRVVAGCPHFTRCGGCSYLNVSYERELQFKKMILEDSLKRTAGLSPGQLPGIEGVHAERCHYRSHGTLKARDGKPGFYRKGTNDFVPVGEHGCFLLSKELNAWLNKGKEFPDDCRVAVDSFSRVITSYQDDPVVRDTECGLRYSRGIGQFFQSNLFLRGRMLEIVKEYSGITGNEVFLDIGCGVGFFSLALAGLSRSGTGIDISGESIRWARYNARQNNVTNVDFRAIPSNRIQPDLLQADLVVADPPRAGIDKKTREMLLAMKPSRIVYVSCNPSTFARDSRDLISGGYSMDRITLIDMFPGTHHIEVISRFIT
jgi:23S rRNA (uracil1939-C5)-methyltransferase